MTSKQYWLSVGQGSVGPRKPETEQHCFKMPPTPTLQRIHKVPVWRRANIGTGVSGPRVSPSDVFSPLAQI